jgi:hypothetical protein
MFLSPPTLELTKLRELWVHNERLYLADLNLAKLVHCLIWRTFQIGLPNTVVSGMSGNPRKPVKFPDIQFNRKSFPFSELQRKS